MRVDTYRSADPRIRRPVVPDGVVHRPRLFRRLVDAEQAPLVLVSASAGTGKTTLVADWLSQEAAPGVGWVELEDDDTAGWDLLTECLAGLGVDVARGAPLMSVVAALVGAPEPVTVVVDGGELTSLDLAHRLDVLLRHASARLRLVLVTRVDPVLPLYRYRLDQSLVEIRAADLAFTDAEAAELFQRQGLRLAPGAVQEVNARVNGWAAGLRFAARALVERHDPAASVSQVVSQQDDMNEYLVREVLDAQPPAVRRFLLDTSVADVLEPGLAEELAGAGATRMLAELTRANVFLEAVAEPPGSYRYVSLFRDLLRVLLAYEDPRRWAEQHERAARWFRATRSPEHAVAHLAAIAAWPELAALVVEEQLVGRLLMAAEGDPLVMAARHLPADLDESSVCVVRAAAALREGERVRCAEELDRARRLRADDARGADGFRASVTVLDAVRGALVEEPGAARRLVDAARSELRGAVASGSTPGVPQLRALTRLAGGLVALRRGELAVARKTLRGAADEVTTGFDGFRAVCLGYLSVVEALEGRLAAAAGTAQEAAALADGVGLGPADRLPGAEAALALVALERYELLRARSHLAAATRSRFLSADPVNRALVEAVRAGLERAGGHLPSAIARLDAAARSLDPTDHWLAGSLRAEAARFNLTAGKPAAALESLSALAACDDPGVAVVEAAALAQRGHGAAAAELLARVRTQDQPLRTQISRLLVEAAEETRGRAPARAAAALDRSLRLAAPEALRRPFREAPPAVQRILETDPRLRAQHQWLSRGTAEAQSVPQARPVVPRQRASSTVVEGLTAKELEVLGHLEELLTTEEIAQKMFVSVNTVRTHIRSILRKLGVNRRYAAVRKARELGILGTGL